MRVGRYFRDGSFQHFFTVNNRTFGEESLYKLRERPAFPQQLGRALESGMSADWVTALPFLEDFILSHDDESDTASSSMPDRLAAPVQPRNVICVGLNYRDHAQESEMAIPKQPLLFGKSVNTISGHNQQVVLPWSAVQVDYEAELGVVIGQTCKRVKAAQAHQVIAGYLCGNDVSARDFQFGDGQWFRGKSADGFAPIGPRLVTPSEVPDPGNLRIQFRLNNRVMQDATTSSLIFSIPELIEFITQSITLSPGDLILTGTPPGVGFARKPPVFLRAGDLMEVDIENIGTLVNTVVEDVDQPD